MRKYKTRLLRSAHRPHRQQESIRYLEEQVFDPEAFEDFRRDGGHRARATRARQ